MASVETHPENFIRSALSADAVSQPEDTSLALPTEEKIRLCGSQVNDRNSRVQQQVQLTIRRKSRRGISNGSLQQSSSFSENRSRSEYEKESLTKSEKLRSTVGYENGFSTGRACSSGQMLKEGTTRPFMRVEVSPQSSPEVPHSRFTQSSLHYRMGHGGVHTLPANQVFLNRTSELNRAQSVGAAQRYYAHSEILSSRKPSMARAKHLSRSQYQRGRPGPPSDDGVFLPNFSVAAESQRPGTSHSIPNVLEVARPGASMRQHWRHGSALHAHQSTWKQTFVQRESSQRRSTNRGSGPSSLISMELDGNARSAAAAQERATGAEILRRSVSEVKAQKAEGQITELTVDKAVNLLTHRSIEMQISAANVIQHQCFLSSEAKKVVFYMHGIPKLIKILECDNVELQRAASGALRNIVFENNDNKMEVKDKDGIPALLRLLKRTRDIETKKQITGLLWNLSSHDLLKDYLAKEALQTITDTIIIPCSGLSDGDYPKEDLLVDPDLFYNATGCLRNISSGGPEGRKAMRSCDSFIDSLVHYVRGTIADYKPDDKSTENCVCILHNLCYQMEAELPQKYIKEIHESRQNLAAPNSTPGCFGSRSTKPNEAPERRVPFPEEKSNPRGVEWLWSPITIRMYLSLIAKSTRKFTQEASIGSLQNLTAGSSLLSNSIAHTIVRKENGLQHIQKMLQSADRGVQRTAVSLLRNMSRYQELHRDMGNQILPDLLTILPGSGTSTDVPPETTVSICSVLMNLVQDDTQNARSIVNNKGMNKIISISTSDNGYGPTRGAKAAATLLHAMWRLSELHNFYRKAGFKKAAFINCKTIKAINLP
ncbi:plakophilin-2 [Lepisosteus oculatus]|uniref:plakophilin-2 n=1 Tax=Lepisosteus oculatus TaxID=7918 RepID=UPI003716214F